MNDTFTIGEHTYSAVKMDAFRALHVARRLSPIVGQLVLLSNGTLNPKDAVLPLMEGIARMSDEDFDYVRDSCLSVVTRVIDGRLHPIFNSKAKLLQYQDIKPKECLEIIFTVVMDNLSDFLDDLPSIVTDGTEGQPSPQ